MKLWFLVTTPFLIVLGCATSSKDTVPTIAQLQPPSIKLEESRSKESQIQFLKEGMDRDDRDLAINWWFRFKWAQEVSGEYPKEACDVFLALAKEPFFPIKELAQIKSYLVCDQESYALTIGEAPQTDSFPQWLSHYKPQVERRIFLQTANLKKLMEIEIQESKKSLVTSKKLKHTYKALDYAEQLNDEKSIAYLKERIYRISPKLNKDPKLSQMMSVAYDFRRSREFDKARKAYRLYLTQPRLSLKRKLSALRGIRTTYKIEKNDELYVKTTEEMTTLARKAFQKRKRPHFSDVIQYAKTHRLLARTYWTLNHSEKAKKLLLSLSKQLKAYPFLQPEIFWLIGRIDEESGQFQEAVNWFETALKYTQKDKGLKNKLSWYYAWNLRRIGKSQKAIRVFSHLLAELDQDKDYDRHRAKFWLGMTLLEEGRKKESQELFKELADDDTIGYYGLLARREIDRPISLTSEEISPLTFDLEHRKLISKWLTNYEPLKLQWLISLGENEASLNYIKTIAHSLRKSKLDEFVPWIEVLKLYQSAGHYVRLRYEVALLKKSLRREIYDRAAPMLFPTPFKEQVELAASKFKVAPELIYAIMRQESAFNPKARSPVDAFGLMQILPRSAKKIANQKGIQYQTPQDLFLPLTNIQIGSALLQDLMDRHKGQFIRTVASYNAAESAINGWFATRYRGNTIQFIEDIPYEETQNYIKLVLRNLVYYQLVRSQDRKIPFPDWTLYVYGQSPEAL
ncbi:MAG: lytic transglycosylase domain-containing protein [Bdellovibrionales bacterium]|nr:lytic transglycosylase domain-containing protein [Bdellovibrionales bacterium]